MPRAYFMNLTRKCLSYHSVSGFLSMFQYAGHCFSLDASSFSGISNSSEDDMSDNTLHFGWNLMALDCGIPAEDRIRIYAPSSPLQMDKVVRAVYGQDGIRVVLSTRAETPEILGADGKPFFGEKYKFKPGKDEIIRKGTAGYVVSFGEMLYRALDAVDRARANEINVGLINHPTLNAVDEETTRMVGNSPFVLFVESQKENSGVGIRYGTWLLERGLRPAYNHMGAKRAGIGGQEEQIPYQGLAPGDILDRIMGMAKK